jgi:signal transduction histidine kinase
MPGIRETVRTLLFLVAAVPLGALGAALLIAGWTVTLCLAITPLVVPALRGFRGAVGLVARAEAALAHALLDTAAVRPRASSPGRPGYWRSVPNVLGDGSFWRQQVYLLYRYVLGGAIAIAEVSLLGASLGTIALPIYYRWSNMSFGSWHVDTLGRSFLLVPAGIIGLVVALAPVRPLGALSRSLVRGLLGAGVEEPRPPAAARAARRRWLAVHASLFAFLTLLTTLIWALTTRAYYWPVWVILGLGVPLAIHAWVELVDARPELVRAARATRALAIVAGVAGVLSLLEILIWAVTSRGYFWPVWPIIGFAVVVGAHAAVVAVDTRRSGPLSERIATLETTRAGAVDQQETELRRIERDLHDGAQARLVALGMSIGMAEQKLASDPAGAQELLAEARRGAREALEELRDLARGIHPPVLADRGLEAAISALANRTPLHVRVMIDVDERPPAPVETAAYFVVAEALANTGKHARAEHVDIAVRRRGGALLVEVVDDGVGGADRSGSGLSGLARRVEALDGSFEVASPPGGPTTVKAVLPCGS